MKLPSVCLATNTRQSNIRSGVYGHIDEVFRDVDLIFQNCDLYNPRDSAIGQMCAQCRNRWHELGQKFEERILASLTDG